MGEFMQIRLGLLREYYSIPWVKYLVRTIMVILGILIIALIANYLTMAVFGL